MHNALPLSVVESFIPEMKKRGVSEVARSPRGFIQAYRRAGGSIARIDPEWQSRRENFIKRHMAQVTMRDEPLFDDKGAPTRRHLALIAWAYSPTPSRIRRKNPGRSERAATIVDMFNNLIEEAPAGSFPHPVSLVVDEATALAGRTEARACAAADDGTVYIAPKVLSFDRDRQCGVLMHELAHVALLQAGQDDHTEREADALAESLWGTQINYDDDDIQTIGPGTHTRPERLG